MGDFSRVGVVQANAISRNPKKVYTWVKLKKIPVFPTQFLFNWGFYASKTIFVGSGIIFPAPLLREEKLPVLNNLPPIKGQIFVNTDKTKYIHLMKGTLSKIRVV